jgi:hypothetical protein
MGDISGLIFFREDQSMEKIGDAFIVAWHCIPEWQSVWAPAPRIAKARAAMKDRSDIPGFLCQIGVQRI